MTEEQQQAVERLKETTVGQWRATIRKPGVAEQLVWDLRHLLDALDELTTEVAGLAEPTPAAESTSTPTRRSGVGRSVASSAESGGSLPNGEDDMTDELQELAKRAWSKWLPAVPADSILGLFGETDDPTGAIPSYVCLLVCDALRAAGYWVQHTGESDYVRCVIEQADTEGRWHDMGLTYVEATLRAAVQVPVKPAQESA